MQDEILSAAAEVAERHGYPVAAFQAVVLVESAGRPSRRPSSWPA